MSDAVTTAILATIAPTVLALATLVAAIKNGKKSDGIEKKADGIEKKVDKVHELTNGMSDKLATAARAEGHAAGVEQEKANQQERER